MSISEPHMVTGTFSVDFPIDDLDMTMGELKAEARERTRAAADQDGLRRIAPVKVSVAHGASLIKTEVQVAWTGAQPTIRGYVD